MKKLMALVLTLVCLLPLAGCSHKNMTIDIGEASKMNIESPFGEVKISDSAVIQSITEDINSLKFEKASTTTGKVDYIYMLTWFDEKNNQIASVAITEENGRQISHNGNYYNVSEDLNIDVDFIDERVMKTFSSSIVYIEDIVSVFPENSSETTD